jgi:hypothetical protein
MKKSENEGYVRQRGWNCARSLGRRGWDGTVFLAIVLERDLAAAPASGVTL